MSVSESGKRLGRPPGATSKLHREAREQAALTGRLPHEILLDMARGLPVRVMIDSGKVDEEGNKIFAEEYKALDIEGVKDAAKAASPYFAPKLSAVETITGLTDEQLLEIITGAAAEAKISIGHVGAGTQAAAEEPSRPRVRIRIQT